MASCLRCGAANVAHARFCATCGNPVGSTAPPPPPAVVPVPGPVDAAPRSIADPFAKTIIGEEKSGAAPKVVFPTQEQPVVSPKAASVWKDPAPPMPGFPARSPAPAVPQPAAAAPPPARSAPSPNPPPAQPPPAVARPQPPAVHAQPAVAQGSRPPPPFVPGGIVLVYWADGNQYPGTVLQVSPYHVLVAFPNGVQHWIEMRYVTASR